MQPMREVLDETRQAAARHRANNPAGRPRFWLGTMDGRWPRFSLRAVLLMTLCLGVLLAYPASLIRQTMLEQQRVRELQHAGAKLGFARLGPRWLGAVLGEERLRVVRMVELEGLQDADALVESALSLPQLQTLLVDHCTVSDGAFRSLPDCPKITNIRVRRCPVGDRFYSYVARTKSLKEIDVRWTQVSAAAILRDEWLHRRNLQCLGFSDGDLSEASRNEQGLMRTVPLSLRAQNRDGWHIPTQHNRDHLDLEQRTVLLQYRFGQSKAGKLSLDNPIDISLLHRLGDLTDLQLEDPADDSLEHLRAVPNLSHLNINGPRLTRRGIACLLYCPNLRTLSLRNVPLGNSELKTIAQLRGLKQLWLSKPLINDAGLEHLVDLPLVTLQLDNANVSANGISSLKKLKHLEQLHILYSPVQDRAAIEISDMQQLRGLSLVDADLTEACLDCLPRLTSLETLNLSQNRAISAEAFTKLSRKMPNCKVYRYDRTISPHPVKPE